MKRPALLLSFLLFIPLPARAPEKVRAAYLSIDDMNKTTKVQREIKTADIFEPSFVRKANDELKASGWKP